MSVDTKYGEAIFKQTQEVAEMFKAAMPKITTNKNGYEIKGAGEGRLCIAQSWPGQMLSLIHI